MWVELLVGLFLLLLWLAVPRIGYYRKMAALPGPHISYIARRGREFMSGGKGMSSKMVFKILAELANEYRKEGMMRVWFGHYPVLMLFQGEKVEALLGSKTQVKKAPQYDVLRSWMGQSLGVSTPEIWKPRRKLFVPAFHWKILDGFIPVFQKHSENFVAKILPSVREGKPVDIKADIVALALDIVGETSIGVEVNALQRVPEWADALFTLSGLSLSRIASPWYWYEWIFLTFSENAQLWKSSIRILHHHIRSMIKIRKEEMRREITDGDLDKWVPDRTFSVLDVLLLSHLRDPRSIDEKGIQDELITMMFAGHDTSGITLVWTLMELAFHPQVQKRVHDELDEIFCGDQEGPITPDHIKRMTYLEAVCKESLRMHPPAPRIGRQLTEDTKIGDHIIPKDTVCFVVIDELGRDPIAFPKPETFDPDRFLPEQSEGRNQFAFGAFSNGIRGCLGIKYAYVELKVVLATILRQFSITGLGDREECLKADVDMILRSDVNMNVLFKKR